MGLRLQLLLLLGALLGLTFFPLFHGVSAYASYSMLQVRRDDARSLGRAVAAHVVEARSHRGVDGLEALLVAQIGAAGVDAVAVYDRAGARVAAEGDEGQLAALPSRLTSDREMFEALGGERGGAIVVVVPSPEGAVATVVTVDEVTARVAPVVSFVGSYMLLVGLALLVITYFALTRLIVQPLGHLVSAAERVAGGGRALEAPSGGARELVELGASLRRMTHRLVSNEESLRREVEEVARATRRLERAQDRLVRSERLASVGRLAAGLAHEIGNPIAALLGLEDLLLDGELSEEERRDFVRRMKSETVRIHRILRDLLQFARPAGAVGSADEPGSVAEAIEDTAALLRPQRSMRDVSLELRVAPDLPAVGLSRERLVQVLLNLLLNAADAVGGPGTIRVDAEAEGELVRVDVADSGAGVPAELRDRIFEPFVSSKGAGDGTGLGLAVCRSIVEAAGGTVQLLEASPLAGACFRVELPAHGARGPLSSVISELAPGAASPSTTLSPSTTASSDG